MRAAAATFAALALAVGACASDTGIIVEVSWNAATLPEADTLRIYVGTGDPTRATVDEASISEEVATVTAPYRYLLRPDGALGEIGPLVIAAGLTAGDPPRGVAFAVHPDQVAFADGEIRTVRLTLGPRAYEVHGSRDECALYADDLGQVRGLGLPGDADCDNIPDGADCADLDPSNDADGDGATCDVDCLDSGGSLRLSPDGLEIFVKPDSVFPGQNLRDFRAMNAVPPHIDCLHVDFDCSARCGDEAKLPNGDPTAIDTDLSGADRCGAVMVSGDAPICPIAPSDCDPDLPGDNSTAESEGEVCDGGDTDCDGRAATPIVCTQPASQGCAVGARACDDGSGRYHDSCEIVGTWPASDPLCRLPSATVDCRVSDDPLGCVVEPTTIAALVRECAVSLGCKPGLFETVGVPVLNTSAQCTWTVVGGIEQGDWTIGFVEPGSLTIEATSTSCGPVVAAVARVENPHDYTVLLVGADGGRVIRRFHLVKLKADSNVCNGMIDCDLTLP